MAALLNGLIVDFSLRDGRYTDSYCVKRIASGIAPNHLAFQQFNHAAIQQFNHQQSNN
jgi:hypothetical protein